MNIKAVSLEENKFQSFFPSGEGPRIQYGCSRIFSFFLRIKNCFPLILYEMNVPQVNVYIYICLHTYNIYIYIAFIETGGVGQFT